jgi:predicted 2-oxoglutarate/Fe(II)-dependent dioxygenase YbiX
MKPIPPFVIGQRAEALLGAGADHSFYSPDSQAGRPAVLLLLGNKSHAECKVVLQSFAAWKPKFDAMQADIVGFASIGNVALAAACVQGGSPIRIVFAVSDALFRVGSGGMIDVVIVDRSGRIVETIGAVGTSELVSQAMAAISRCVPDHSALRTMTAPILIVPNIIEESLCAELIRHFESGSHVEGVMASAGADGTGYSKRDLEKKRRHDLVLEVATPLHGRMVDVVSSRLLPEIRAAFQVDIAHLDRFLIARYDVGGCFLRHRDNNAPHVAYRQFALTLNLNAGDYEGGGLVFPEYSDTRFSPPTGGALVFSASLLHEATCVTSGSRYVFLTFMHTREAEIRRLAYAESRTR